MALLHQACRLSDHVGVCSITSLAGSELEKHPRGDRSDSTSGPEFGAVFKQPDVLVSTANQPGLLPPLVFVHVPGRSQHLYRTRVAERSMPHGPDASICMSGDAGPQGT